MNASTFIKVALLEQMQQIAESFWAKSNLAN